MRLPVQECGKGLNLDLLPSEVAPGVWSDGSNVRFRNGFAQKRKGTTAAYTTPTATPYWIGTYITSSARFLVQLGTATAFVDDGTTRTEITGTPPTGARDDRWSGFDFNGVFVCNNGVDDPMFWNGDVSTDLAALTGWTTGTKADALCQFRDYIFALAPTISGTKYPYRILWGNAAEPGSLPTTYTAASVNDAGDKDLAGRGPLVDGLVLGDALILYFQKGRYAVRWVGGPYVFSFEPLAGEDGILARGCVVNVPGGHVFLTNGDVRMHSGGESQSIAEGWVRKWLAANMDSTYASRSFLCLNPQENEVWVCFPSTGQTDCDTVLAWNWVDNTWSKFTQPSLTYGAAGLVPAVLSATTYNALAASVTYETITTLYSQNEAASNEARLIVATTTPTIGLANTGSLDFGTRVSWYLEKRGIALSEHGERVKSVSRLWPHFDATAGFAVTVKITTNMRCDDDPSYSGSATYTQGSSQCANKFTKAGRYASVRFEGTDDALFALRSYQLELTGSGGKW